MSKNLIPQIAEMLGVELGEKFKIKGHEELTYKFASDRLELTYDNNIELSEIATKVALVALLNGKDEIVKLPWKRSAPKLALLKVGWVYRTKEEAEASLPAVAKELEVAYEL